MNKEIEDFITVTPCINFAEVAFPLVVDGEVTCICFEPVIAWEIFTYHINHKGYSHTSTPITISNTLDLYKYGYVIYFENTHWYDFDGHQDVGGKSLIDHFQDIVNEEGVHKK